VGLRDPRVEEIGIGVDQEGRVARIEQEYVLDFTWEPFS